MGMMNRLKYLGLFAALLLSCQVAQAQEGTLPADEKAEQLVTLGKKYISTENWKEASQTFILASQRPDNQLTTATLYYLALSWYHLDELENARRRFDQLIKEYPGSKYADEARYHLALVNLESPHVNDKERGMDLLLRLADGAADTKLKQDALNAAKHYLFEVLDVKFLDLYFMFVSESHRITVLEAICHQLDLKNNGRQIMADLKAWEEEGNALSPFLAGLKSKYSGVASGGGKVVSGGEIHIAVVLAFHLEVMSYDSIVPKQSQRALDFYEGMRYAIEKETGLPGPHLVIKVWDSQGDSTFTKNQLGEIEAFDPDLIIGDIGAAVNQVLARWAEAHKVVQIIPRNPLDELVQGRSMVFLAHPSQKRQGEAMAEHAVKTLGMDRILVLNDYSANTDVYAKAFIEKAKALGGHPEERRITPRFDGTLKSVPASVRSGGFEAIYAPLESEENMGLLLSELMLNRVQTTVFTTNDIEKMTAVDSDSKTDANLTYSTHYCECNDSAGFAEMRQNFVNDWSLPAQEYTIQGYDVMRWLLQILRSNESHLPLATQLKAAAKQHSLHIDFHMEEKQINQKVNIVRFRDGRLIKVN